MEENKEINKKPIACAEGGSRENAKRLLDRMIEKTDKRVFALECLRKAINWELLSPAQDQAIWEFLAFRE